MTKKVLLIILGVVVLGGGALWYFFSGSTQHMKLIPKEAMAIVTVDWSSLAKKADFEKLKELSWYKELREKENQEDVEGLVYREILESPLSTGINIMSDIFFYTESWSDSEFKVLVFDVKDAGDLEETMKKIDSNLSVQLGSNFRYAKLDNSLFLAWNDKGGTLVSSGYYGDPELTITYLERNFKRPSENTMAEVSEFVDFIEKDNDVGIFINGNGIYESSVSQSRGMSISDLNNIKLMQNTYGMLALNFNDNDVQLDFDWKVSPELEKYDFMQSSGLSNEDLQYVTDSTVYSCAALNLNIKGYYDFYKTLPEVADAIQEFQEENGMNEEQLLGLLSGKATYGLTSITYEVPQYNQESLDELYFEYTPRPQLKSAGTLWIGSNNKEGFKKILTKNFFQESTEGDYKGIYFMNLGFGGLEFFAVETPAGFMFTNDVELAKKAKGGSLGTLPDTFAARMKDSPMSAYMNLNQADYPEAMKQGLREQVGREWHGVSKFLEITKDVEMMGEKTSMVAKLNLVPGDGNSLYRIIKQIDTAATYYEEQRKKEREELEKMEEEMMRQYQEGLFPVPNEASPF
jgi:hypothetical protein